jgi:hypothetical protein
VSGIEGFFGKHSTESLLVSTRHAAVQLCPSPPIFHIRIPSEVHCANVDMAMLLVNPLSPGGKTSLSEAYLPAAPLRGMLPEPFACSDALHMPLPIRPRHSATA